MEYFVYILFSESHNRFYIGQTNCIEQRLDRHNDGYEKATLPYKPCKLILFIEKPTRGEALVLEKKLKNLNTEDLKKFIGKYSKWHQVARFHSRWRAKPRHSNPSLSATDKLCVSKAFFVPNDY